MVFLARENKRTIARARIAPAINVLVGGSVITDGEFTAGAIGAPLWSVFSTGWETHATKKGGLRFAARLSNGFFALSVDYGGDALAVSPTS